MEFVREAIRLGLALGWSYLLARGVRAIERNDRQEKEARSKARREATTASTNAWVALYQDEQRRHCEDVSELQQRIIDLEARIDQYEQEIARWKLIGNKLWESKK